ncbi:MAG: hypothetical protein EYC69_05970 [Bacteroidetes bacterium]|nr:MAG: hypothetical protein EYC69_05970 [Bacteroidota bacterium]
MKLFKLLFFLLFLSPFFLFSQTESRPTYGPRKDKHKNKTDELDRKQGLWKHYDYYGTLIMEIEYLNDKRNGMYRRYYTNGRLMRETEYLDGIKDGIFKKYSFDGLVTEGEYSEGKKENIWTNYYSNGQIRSTGIYKKGLKEGEWKYYNRKGEPNGSIIYKGGRDIREIEASAKKAAEEKKLMEAKKKTVKYR